MSRALYTSMVNRRGGWGFSTLTPDRAPVPVARTIVAVVMSVMAVSDGVITDCVANGQSQVSVNNAICRTQAACRLWVNKRSLCPEIPTSVSLEQRTSSDRPQLVRFVHKLKFTRLVRLCSGLYSRKCDLGHSTRRIKKANMKRERDCRRL